MKRIVCEACGSNDLVKGDENYFVCQSCGAKYTAEAIKTIIEGKVELVVGKEELDRMVNNAKTFSELGGLENRRKALECIREAMDKFPSYVEVWTAYIELQLEWYTRIKTIPTKEEISEINSVLSSIRTLSKDPALAEKYKSSVADFWNLAAEGIERGDWIISTCVKEGDLWDAVYYWECVVGSDAFKHTVGKARDNAELLNAVEYVYDDEEYEWVKVKPYAPKRVRLMFPKEVFVEGEDGSIRYFYVGESDILDIAKREKAELEAKKAAERAQMISNKLYCKHCDKISGVKKLFGIKCSVCGRKL